jgi:phage tail-like protein
MAELTVNPHRFDPYRNYKFRVVWDGKAVAGISRISALRRTTEAVEYREGGEPPNTSHVAPGRTTFDAVTLERGVSHDAAFEDWANQGGPAGSQAALPGFRKDIAIELCDEAGNLLRRYLVHRCWVSGYTALPDLDGSCNEVLIESITLRHEGWERDLSVAQPRGT